MGGLSLWQRLTGEKETLARSRKLDVPTAACAAEKVDRFDQ